MRTHAPRASTVRTEIFRNRFQGVVDEMGYLLMRAAHNVFVKETQDFVVALVTPDGEVFAASRKVGIWIAIGLPFRHVVGSVPLSEGDVGITNSPDGSRGLVTHLPDVFLWKPVYAAGRLLCYAATFVHCTDVGGLVPGSVALTAREQRQEGMVIPPCRLIDRGRENTALLDAFLANSRVPEQNRGDLRAMLAALDKAEGRVHEMVARYGAEEVREGYTAVLAHAEQQARAIFSTIPGGSYHFVDYLEGDFVPGGQPIRIELTLRAGGGDVELDFSGTDLQIPAALNFPTHSQDGHYLIVMGLVNFLRTVNPEITYNSGMVRPVRVRIPRGSLLNPEPGAACGARQATFFRVADVVLGALARAVPQRVPTAGAGQGAILLVAAPDLKTGEERVSTVQPLVGGSGGRPWRDGTDGVDFVTGFYRNIPTEILEYEIPVVVERYGLRRDSAGPGRYRGGAGVEYTIRIAALGAVVTARGLERYHFQPWGRDGGHPGAPSRTVYEAPGAPAEEIGKIDVLRPGPGSRVTFMTPGGGGAGDPLARDPAAVLRDVEDGLVSVDAARSAYGVVIRDGAVDGAETARARSVPRDAAPAFAFGIYREQFEAAWPAEMQRAINRLLEDRPPAVQQHLKVALLQAIRDLRRADPAAHVDLEALLAEILATLERPVVEAVQQRPQAPYRPPGGS